MRLIWKPPLCLIQLVSGRGSQKRLGKFWLNFEELLGVTKEKKSKEGHCSQRVSLGQRSGNWREQKHIWEDCESLVQMECRERTKVWWEMKVDSKVGVYHREPYNLAQGVWVSSWGQGGGWLLIKQHLSSPQGACRGLILAVFGTWPVEVWYRSPL